jgi:hypothetical protein
MAFHPEKCNVLTITKKRNPIKFNYTLHGHSLEHVTSAKYLGCTITSDLKWGPHINNICNKANYEEETLEIIRVFIHLLSSHYGGYFN